jgi:hypothetical protein
MKGRWCHNRLHISLKIQIGLAELRCNELVREHVHCESRVSLLVPNDRRARTPGTDMTASGCHELKGLDFST